MTQSKKGITLFFWMIYLAISTSFTQINLSTNYFGIRVDEKGLIASMKSSIATREGVQFKAAPVGARFINALHNGKKITIVTMGTSLTGGAWPWPNVMMNDWLNKEFPGQVTCFNEGVGASSSSVGPDNNPALSGIGKLPAVIAHKPDVVFIEFATNDAYLPYKISLEQSAKNLNIIIDQILEANRNTEIILQTMNTVIDKPGGSPNASSRPQLGEYTQACRDVAKERGLLIVDNYPNWEKLVKTSPARFDELVPDGIHPRFPGYREILLPELKKSLDPVLNNTQ